MLRIILWKLCLPPRQCDATLGSSNKRKSYCAFKQEQAIRKGRTKCQGKKIAGVIRSTDHRSICSHKLLKKYSNNYSMLITTAQPSLYATDVPLLKIRHLLHELQQDMKDGAEAPLYFCRLYILQTCHVLPYTVTFLPHNFIRQAKDKHTKHIFFTFPPSPQNNARIWDALSD